jgi:hypothetical protein
MHFLKYSLAKAQRAQRQDDLGKGESNDKLQKNENLMFESIAGWQPSLFADKNFASFVPSRLCVRLFQTNAFVVLK